MPGRILFAEDEDGFRNIIVQLLTEEGFEVEGVNDGVGAIEALQKGKYDLLLLDIRMPIKSGLDVLEYMHSNDIRIRSIMATAVNDMSIAIESLKLGASDFITKPYTIESLVECINKVLEK
ncbi:MAG TPA: response regulator [Bacteroidetes bacterium]|nr:response regulator [Bacteroidota bacterium]